MMNPTPTIAQQTFAALSAFAITASLMFASFAPPAQTVEQSATSAEVQA